MAVQTASAGIRTDCNCESDGGSLRVIDLNKHSVWTPRNDINSCALLWADLHVICFVCSLEVSGQCDWTRRHVGGGLGSCARVCVCFLCV